MSLWMGIGFLNGIIENSQDVTTNNYNISAISTLHSLLEYTVQCSQSVRDVSW
jgi:hypothetical protein